MKELEEVKKPPWLIMLGAMLFLQFVAGICYPIAKYGLVLIEPYTFAFYRFLLSSSVLLIMVALKNHDRAIERRDWGRIVLLGFIIIPFNQTLFLVGQSLTGAGHGAFLFSTTPVWIFVLALIHLKETSSLQRALGFVVATLGVGVIMVSGAVEIGTDYLLGDVIILVSVVAWGYYTIIGKSLVRKYGALRITAYSLSIGSALYFPFGLYRALQYDYSSVTLAAWGSVAYMAIGLSVVVYVLWLWLLKYMEASRIAIYHNIQPIIATLVAYLFLHEVVGWPFVIGGIAVIGGVIISEVRLKLLSAPPSS